MPAGVKTENITIVLNKPKYPGNVGFVARCAKNMGIDGISVVDGNDLDCDVMKQVATHFAAGIVDRIRYFDRLEEALAGFQYIVGTTSRLGSARGHVIYPREMAEHLIGISQNNNEKPLGVHKSGRSREISVFPRATSKLNIMSLILLRNHAKRHVLAISCIILLISITYMFK